jgi:hypothetical protein
MESPVITVTKVKVVTGKQKKDNTKTWYGLAFHIEDNLGHVYENEPNRYVFPKGQNQIDWETVPNMAGEVEE